MRSGLDHLPAGKQRELHHVLDVLHAEFENATADGTSVWKRKARIRSVILFGSYARGEWIDEPHTAKGYQSDYDILVIVNHEKLKTLDTLWNPLWERLFRDHKVKTPVNFIVHTLAEVNEALALGRYFFVDIYRQGIEFYGTKGTRLRPPQPLSPQTALEMAEEYAGILPHARYHCTLAEAAIRDGHLRHAAFNLHQAVEQACHAFLLTLTNYCPATHDLNALRGLAEGLDQRLVAAWPRATKADRKPFNKLVEAYVKARYSRHYRIDRQMLDGLLERITHLHTLVETACAERLTELRQGVHENGTRQQPHALNTLTGNRQMMTASDNTIAPDDVLTFWAEAGPEKWWKKDAAFDALIATRFGAVHKQAASGLCDDWVTRTPDAALALIIVLDQFSRNLHRGTPLAYACDDKAVALAHRLIAQGTDRRMRDDLVRFAYMPLMHSEKLSDQDISVAQNERSGGGDNLKFARHHRDIIARFGRFPHRNDLLGRQSTAEEVAFLRDGGFAGQG